MQIMKEERDNYIDFCRGIAAINIIIIHVVFWSGASYIPEWTRNLSLILDVPFFFFLSGWGRGLNKNISFSKWLTSLINIYKKFVIFIFLVYLIWSIITLCTTGSLSLKILFNDFFISLFFYPSKLVDLPVLFSSIWFLPIYFTVIPLSGILFTIMNIHNEDTKQNAIILFLCFFFGYFAATMGYQYFHITVNTWFYSLFFLEGYILAKIKPLNNKQFAFLGGVMVLIFAIYIASSPGSIIVQNLKFPPHFGYFAYSQITILLALYFKRLKISSKNIFVVFGRNAINFYFCQGIATSLLIVKIVPYLTMTFTMKWQIKFLICSIFSITTTVLLAFILNIFYKCYERVEKYLYSRFFYIPINDIFPSRVKNL